jgi:two-component system chemotaxis sensor kinase CheA
MDEDLALFYEDAQDQLQYMENALLDALDNKIDTARIDEIFRAMHTIKGNAGMFNFEEIVSLTHKAENLLDNIRENKLTLNQEISLLLIQVKDIVYSLVDSSINNLPIEQETQKELHNIESNILKYMPNQEDSKEPSIEQLNSIVDQMILSRQEEEEKEKLWHISLRLEPDFLNSGMDILSILKYFLKSGEILLNIPILNDIPYFENLNPTKVYTGFEIDYQSDSTKEDIIEIFEFVEDDVDLIVFEHDDKVALKNLLEKRESNLKDILLENFSYEEEFFQNQKQKQTEESIEIKEPLLVETKSKNNPIVKDENDFFLKVNSKKIDELINKVSQMVIKNSELNEHIQDEENEDLDEILYSMQTLLEDVRDSVMNIRMVQVKDSFSKYRRIVNDTASKLGKQIDFCLVGEDTELDKSVIEKLSDPLTHMIRNSCDHGIESTEERIQKGKSPKGKITLKTYPDAGTIVIEIKDDGAGINKDAVLQKAIQNNIVSKTDNLSDKEIYQLIFSAGLSTASQVSDLSGRGVGMDVVKRNIEQLRGSIEVNSSMNKGSTIKVRLPLTLAIIDGFLVQSGHSKFIIPLETISQCIELTPNYQSDIKGANTININNKVLPLLNLRQFYKDKITSEELIQKEDEDEYRQNVIIVKFASYEVGLLVDELYGQQQTVIKPLGEIFKKIPGISGGSILGDGQIAFILDIPKLIETQIKKG